MNAPRDLSEYQPIPVGEAVDLPHEDGWKQWHLAVRLQDAEPVQPVVRAPSWALEPMEAA